MLITMSDKEIQRLVVLQDVRDHRITLEGWVVHDTV